MRERLLARDVLELVGAAAEGAAAGGQHQPVDGAGPLAGDQLVERRVLGVDRDHAARRWPRPARVTSSPPTTRLSLLASARSMPSPSVAIVGPEPGRADQRVQHEVAVGVGDQLDEPLGARQHLAAGPRLGGAWPRRPRRPARSAPRRARAACSISCSQLEPAASADDLELVAALDHVERLGRRSSRSSRG